jgi:hypothetical protein
MDAPGSLNFSIVQDTSFRHSATTAGHRPIGPVAGLPEERHFQSALASLILIY